MLRDQVMRVFDEILPDMGMKPRAAQVAYAMMVTDNLEIGAAAMRAAAETGDDTEEPSKYPGVRPVFEAIEAGTGTGKTLGYLIPVLLHIAQSGGRARITTHTLALQDQIYGRNALYADRQPSYADGDRSDMAIALEAVARVADKRLTSGFRKGRQAYVSPMAVMEWLDQEKTAGVRRSGEDAARLQALREWAVDVQAMQNRKDELNDLAKNDEQAEAEALMPALLEDMLNDPLQGLIAGFMDMHDGLPDGISASDIGMVPKVEDNPFHRHHGNEGETADVLVVSHTLSLIDLQMGGVLLPAAQVIVHDEADTMAGVAEMYARKKIPPHLLLHAMGKAFGGESAVPEAIQHLRSLLKEMSSWFAREYALRNPEDAEGVPVLPRPVLEVMLDDKTALATSSVQYIQMLEKSISDVLALKSPENASMDRMRFRGVLEKAKADLRRAEQAFPANAVSRMRLDGNGLPIETAGGKGVLALGLSWTPARKLAAFEVVDLFAGRLFSKEWFFKSDTLETVLLTSATLRTPAAESGKAGEWDYVHRLLGTPEAVGRTVNVKRFGSLARIHALDRKAPEPFLKMVPGDREPKYNPEWVYNVHLMLADMLKTGERGLVLASSFRDVKTIMEGFASPHIWWQTNAQSMHWQDGVRALQEGAAQIMVTPSVWAGANIRGADGQQLFRHQGILRQPVPPEDTLREKLLANYFRQKGLFSGDPDAMAKNVVRKAALQAGMHKMTQGLGRGIRAAGDAIEVWLMDPRLMAPQWQATFPERFRGLFADPNVLHVVDVSTKEDSETPTEKRSSLMNLLKTQPAKKNTGKNVGKRN